MSVPTSWADFGAIATIAQTFIILTAALYARNQFREADRNRRLLATTELFRIIGEEEFRLLRDWAMNDLPGVDATKSPSDLAKARKVAVKYDRLAYMVHQDLLPRKALLDFQADELIDEYVDAVFDAIPRLWRRLHDCEVARNPALMFQSADLAPKQNQVKINLGVLRNWLAKQ